MMRTLRCVAGLLLAVLLAACDRSATAPGGARPPTLVDVEEVKAQVVPNLVELPGRVEAGRSGEVRARADGIIERPRDVDGRAEEHKAGL